MTTKITYEFEATADNSALLAAINSLLHAHAQGAVIDISARNLDIVVKATPLATEEKKAEPATEIVDEPVAPVAALSETTPTAPIEEEKSKGESTQKAEETPLEQPETAPAEEEPDISPHLAYNDVKEAARDAKKTHGDAFTKSVLEDHDCDIKTTLVRSLAGIPEEKYQSIVQAWVKGPTKSTSIFEEEKQEEPTPEPTPDPNPEPEEVPVEQPDIDPEAVKMALRAYAKKHSKEAAKAVMAEFDIQSLPAVNTADQATLTALFTKVL